MQAKTQHPDESRALYVVAAELGCAADAKFNNLPVAGYMFAAAITGPSKGILEGQAPAELMPRLHRQLVSLCLGYLERDARMRRLARRQDKARQAQARSRHAPPAVRPSRTLRWRHEA